MYTAAGTLILLANLWAITRTLRSDAAFKQKMLWVATVLLLPFVGVVLWIWFGPS
ncbi:MAG: PLDc N-terminal domain-containing protein [Pseudomonadota bacterium]